MKIVYIFFIILNNSQLGDGRNRRRWELTIVISWFCYCMIVYSVNSVYWSTGIISFGIFWINQTFLFNLLTIFLLHSYIYLLIYLFKIVHDNGHFSRPWLVYDILIISRSSLSVVIFLSSYKICGTPVKCFGKTCSS